MLTNLNGVITTNNYTNWLAVGTKTEVTTTVYDNTPSTLPSGFTPVNLRKRVSATYIDNDDNLGNGYTFASYYTYDIHGNVSRLVNDFPALSTYSTQYTYIDYEYDLISGKVNKVTYQKDKRDQFIHLYSYDADNRITQVRTSRDNIVWDLEAKYFYYKHGPLARVELGNNRVQAMDYAYTIQGWIKGMNSANLAVLNDMGKDGASGAVYTWQNNLHKYFGTDAYGYNLNYNGTDYKGISTAANYTNNPFLASVSTNSDLNTGAYNLYNGNISSMVSSIRDVVNSGTVMAQLNTYKYDQLNRINLAKAYNDFTVSTSAFGGGTGSTANLYKNEFTYDANGNILMQVKYDNTNTKFEDLAYKYHLDANSDKVSNRLYHVNDAIGSGVKADDIDDQGTFTQANSLSSSVINSSNNYSYDQIGNLISDDQEKITNIKWNVYGKIEQITKFIPGANSLNTEIVIDFDYDAAGNRIMKTTAVTATISGPPFIGTSYNMTTHYYIRDAQGNVMTTYTINSTPFTGITPIEFNIYGSSRLGMLTNGTDLGSIAFTPTATSYRFDHIRGARNLELSNHLGNVMSVISDRTYPVALVSNTNIIDYYKPEILTTHDYYAFGSQQGGRSYNSGSYRYGFNGKENDNEVKGAGNSVDFGARVYDSRLGRWLSVDPLGDKIPGFTPYNFTANNPIRMVDPDGKFLLDVHQRITNNALKGMNIEFSKGLGPFSVLVNMFKNSDFKNGMVGMGTSISGGVTKPDINQTHNKSAHFDQMNFTQIMENISKVNESTSSAIQKFHAGKYLTGAEGLGSDIGEKLHAIQDLYSHSNYVELYAEAYKGQNDFTKIPTLREAMSDPKFKDFAEVLKSKLKTGDYPSDGGAGSHKQMNHDLGKGSKFGGIMPETKNKKVDWYSKAAEEVATKASKEYLNDVKNEIESNGKK